MVADMAKVCYNRGENNGAFMKIGKEVLLQ